MGDSVYTQELTYIIDVISKIPWWRTSSLCIAGTQSFKIALWRWKFCFPWGLASLFAFKTIINSCFFPLLCQTGEGNCTSIVAKSEDCCCLVLNPASIEQYEPSWYKHFYTAEKLSSRYSHLCKYFGYKNSPTYGSKKNKINYNQQIDSEQLNKLCASVCLARLKLRYKPVAQFYSTNVIIWSLAMRLVMAGVEDNDLVMLLYSCWRLETRTANRLQGATTRVKGMTQMPNSSISISPAFLAAALSPAALQCLSC